MSTIVTVANAFGEVELDLKGDGIVNIRTWLSLRMLFEQGDRPIRDKLCYYEHQQSIL